MNTLTLLVGLPASGKSTFAREHLANDNTIILSSDDLRKELLGNESYQDNNDLVFKSLYKRAKEFLQNGKNVVIDATNINIKARRSALSHFDKMPIIRQALVFATPYFVCVDRDKKRERTVGKNVIKKYIQRFEIPMEYEGFDFVDIIHDDVHYDILTFCKQMCGFEQHNPHHKHTLDNHCINCMELVENKTKNKNLICSANIHDLGKLFTQTFDENGIAHYYSHHNVGAYLLMCCFNDKINREVLFYVNFHMQPFFWKEQKTHDKYKKLFGEELYNNLMILHECDKIASGTQGELK